MWQFFQQLIGTGSEYLLQQEQYRQQRKLLERRAEIEAEQTKRKILTTRNMAYAAVILISGVVVLKITKVI